MIIINAWNYQVLYCITLNRITWTNIVNSNIFFHLLMILQKATTVCVWITLNGLLGHILCGYVIKRVDLRLNKKATDVAKKVTWQSDYAIQHIVYLKLSANTSKWYLRCINIVSNILMDVTASGKHTFQFHCWLRKHCISNFLR